MIAASVSEQVQNAIEHVVLMPVRIRHRRKTRKKRRARTQALATVRNTLQAAARLNAGATKTVFNVGMYVLLLDEDLAFFTDHLVFAIGDRERAFFAKHEAVFLYEAAEDLPQLLGREFREAVRSLGASGEQIDRLNSVSSGLNQFWQRHREFLGTIRNALAAHRDHDALRYAETLQIVKPLEVMSRGAELSQLLEQLVGVLTELAALTAGPVAIIRNMVATSKQNQTD